jgi:tetratricopeptide (TPR) repeat protein
VSADSNAKLDVWMREAYARHSAGELREAAEGYRRILQVDPQHADALFLLGEIDNREGRHAEAVPLLERAAALQPGIAAFHIELADALIRQGRYAEANPHLRTTVQLKIAQGPAATGATPAVTIPRTTLCCVDCSQYDLAAYALRRSLQACRFEQALFFTDRQIEVEGVRTIPIGSIVSTEDYSRFMVKELDRHIDTDFVLVIQYDGFVLDASRWSDEFFAFDYIGARWSFGDGHDVGNGGFSLRSKKLLCALQDAAIDRSFPEDEMICREYRGYLEQRHGIRFAPEALAERFSFETVKRGPTFGFHGLGHLARIVDMSAEELARYDPGAIEVRFTFKDR